VGVQLNSIYAHGWGILHSIPTYDGAGDLDHLLVGPGGVFTVNAKSHPRTKVVVRGDQMSVGRVYVDYVKSARQMLLFSPWTASSSTSQLWNRYWTRRKSIQCLA
jgi:hypothetical protein